eukprot:TRINITY_DN1620_c0_g1_i2.p1 TRINITY_DN1620_c0_g1~~TRINITY_DN1620_c0_g1_i2.p1  ORF type:complete len:353 (+),score=97.28 TRINITY_DN1620_c0_g1_i2:33-1061(+)
MATAVEKKLNEGDGYIKQADKLVTKSLTRWKADWDSAVGLYEKAAVCFKGAKAQLKAKEAYKKAATGFKHIDIPFSVAKNLEAAAMCAKELKEPEETVFLFEEAAGFYRQHQNPEKASEMYIRAAKVAEEYDADKCAQLAVQACDTLEEDGKEKFSGQTFKDAIGLLLKANKMDLVVDLLKRQAAIYDRNANPHDLHKTYLCLVIMYLHLGDAVAADRAFQDGVSASPQLGTSVEGRTASDLITCYEKMDPDLLKKAQAQQCLTFIDNGIAKLALKLRISGGLHTASTTPLSPQKAALLTPTPTVTPAVAPTVTPIVTPSPAPQNSAQEPIVEEEDDPNSIL